MDDYSTNVAQMKTVTDPYPAAAESLATSLAGEIERLRYQVDQMRERFNPAGSQWYHDVGAIRAIQLKLEPGATPGTNIDITLLDISAVGFNLPSITDATDLAKSGSSGSFALDATGVFITMDITETIIGVLSCSVLMHDINTSSTTEMYVVYAERSSGNMRILLRKRGATPGNTDWTGILDAGDRCDVLIAFMTDS